MMRRDEAEVHVVLDRLTPEEDGTLRRLHSLERLDVELSPHMKELKEEIRRRDRRTEIREAEVHAVVAMS